jgi:ABC-type multidrug transport system permease subunit
MLFILALLLLILWFYPLGYLLALAVRGHTRTPKHREVFVVKSVVVAVAAFFVFSSIFGAVAGVIMMFGQFFLGLLLLLLRHLGDD